jgi:hypothetical protein
VTDDAANIKHIKDRVGVLVKCEQVLIEGQPPQVLIEGQPPQVLIE